MATRLKEIELLTRGVDLNHPEKGQYYQNVYRKNGALRVRPGFGQIAQFDSTLGRVDNYSSEGYSACLGTRAMKTNFGHTQIVSVHMSRSYTSNSYRGGGWADIYSVNIYDVTTDERWEEVLYRHTSERSKNVTDISQWHGIYESHEGKEYASWKTAWARGVFFEEAFDVLFFGSKDLGLYMYTPSDFNGNRRKQTDSVAKNEASLPYSESCVVVPVSPANGMFSDAYTYLEEATFPHPVDAAFLGGRLAIARDHDVFFSDYGRPASFIGINSISVPSESKITAVESVADNLLIFTRSETFLYQPNTGDLINAGRLSRISEHIGCIGPNAVSRASNLTMWADSNGFYMTSVGTDLKKISEPIQPFFDDRISNPLTARAETTLMSNNQPRSNFDSNDMSMMSIAYDHLSSSMMVSIPSQNIIWVFQEGAWFLWNLESAKSNSTTVAVNNISNAFISGVDGRVFLHGGTELYTHADSGQKTASFYILELGRGGALDRSLHEKEDDREGTGAYYTSTVASPGGKLFIGPPKNNMYPVHVAFYAMPKAVSQIDISFTFDSTKWELANTGGTIDLVSPPERDTAGVTTKTVSGSTVTIVYNRPHTGMVVGSKNLICYLKFTPLSESKDLGITPGTNSYTDLAPTTYDLDFSWWGSAGMMSKHQSNSLDQQVDWVVKSGQLGNESDGQIKLRTVYVKTKTHGNSTIKTQFASDWSDYKGQSADVVKTNSVDGARSHELFNDGSSQWGTNVLVDEEHYDTVASSLSIKGEHVSVMLHGSISDKAEKVVIDSSTACYKLAGGRRRQGR